MPYNTLEESLQDGSPVELYEFQIGQETLYYTSADADFTYLTRIYTALAINRSAIEETGEMSRRGIEITTARDFPIATRWQVMPPSEVILVRLYRIHRGDTERATLWLGRVLNVEKRGVMAVISCESTYTSFRRLGLRLRYSRPCQYVLYDPDTCKVNKDLWKDDCILTLVDGATLTSAEIALRADDYFAGGYVEWEYVTGSFERRGVRYHVGNQVVMSHAIPNLPNGTTVQIYRGCAHNIADCNSFSNRDNHGGYPYIPNVSPFGGSSVY